MKKKIIIAVIFVIVASMVYFFLLKPDKGSKVIYTKAPVKIGDIEATVITSGTLNPVTRVDVSSQVSGRIAKLNVDFNSKVKKGQTLAELEQSTFIARMQQEEANYRSAEASVEKSKVNFDNLTKKYERSVELFKKNLISIEEKETAEANYLNAKIDIQTAESRLAQAKAQLDSSKVDLEYTIITSPIDGVVITRNMNIGQTVAASYQAPVLFQIANDLSKMQIECDVDEADVGKVKEKQNVRFNVDAFPDDIFQGEVYQLRYSPTITQNVVTYPAIVMVENPELKLRPGMTATVTIIAGEAKNVLIVPNTALRFNPQAGLKSGAQAKGIGRVWIEDADGKLNMITIRTGLTDNTNTEVKEVVNGTFREGEEVIIGQISKTAQQTPSSPPAKLPLRF